MVQKRLKSLLLIVVSASLIVYHFTLIYVSWLWHRLRGRVYPSDHAHQLAILWGQRLFKAIPGWQIEVKGRENISAAGRTYVIVANHESGTDILAIYFLGVQFRWLAKAEVFKMPLVGLAMSLAGYVPIVRGDKGSHLKALALSEERIRQGTPMLFFPEGTRSSDGQMKEFKSGAFRLAKTCGVPVLPVVLHGAGKLLQKKSLCPSAATVQVHVLPPIFSEATESAESYTQRVRGVMASYHQKLAQPGLTEEAYRDSQAAIC